MKHAADLKCLPNMLWPLPLTVRMRAQAGRTTIIGVCWAMRFVCVCVCVCVCDSRRLAIKRALNGPPSVYVLSSLARSPALHYDLVSMR